VRYLIFLLLFTTTSTPKLFLEKVKWLHGSEDCSQNKDVPIQVVQYDSNTWILRQNKCVNYEAPFMFLFFGEKKVLLMDSGATEDESTFPLYQTIQRLIDAWEKNNSKKVELIVAHTHSHGDHWAGDIQFKDKPGVKVVGLKEEDVKHFFNLKNWPTKTSSFDLGNRSVEIIPIPGHDKTSLAVYDLKSKLLLTGDTFYPGRLYVRDWNAFRQSIQRLVDFTSSHKIDYLVGNHIEMSSTPGKDYPTGSTYQPNEAPLPLSIKELKLLNEVLKKMDKPEIKVFDRFVVSPK
jgi:hydroxyacylglutathione hydrolase